MPIPLLFRKKKFVSGYNLFMVFLIYEDINREEAKAQRARRKNIKLYSMERKLLESTARQIVDSALQVHKGLGPGLLESVYQYCLVEELKIRKIRVIQEIFLPLHYRGKSLDKDFRIDILVENFIIIEVKSVEILIPVHSAQIISYLKLADKRLGFLINFNVPLIKDGIKRFVNNY